VNDQYNSATRHCKQMSKESLRIHTVLRNKNAVATSDEYIADVVIAEFHDTFGSSAVGTRERFDANVLSEEVLADSLFEGVKGGSDLVARIENPQADITDKVAIIRDAQGYSIGVLDCWLAIVAAGAKSKRRLRSYEERDVDEGLDKHC
jgi:hypothetical protein